MTAETKARMAALYAANQKVQAYEREHDRVADGVFQVQGAWLSKQEIVSELKSLLAAAKGGSQ